MFRPLYWPSSGCTQLIKQLYNVFGAFWGEEISFTIVSGMNSNLIDTLQITEIKNTIFWHVTERILFTNQTMYSQRLHCTATGTR